MKQKIIIGTGLMGSTAASLFGGWDTALQTLVLFMAIDWFTGGILLPGVFKKSPKSASGALESHAGWKGLCRKAMTLLYVLIAARLDLLMQTQYIRDAVCIGFIVNESLSIVENAGLMGLPLPDGIRKGIDALSLSAGKEGK
ncbi:MAG: phage holin family protein [Lachnospiraceae bacterium]|nr:phage holin family protein [Lachnospiraceae bacterium]MDD3615250.1 phage holin family protein [Lachnospiraceae bacterium]